MPYIINKYDGSLLTSIADTTTDNSTSLTLVGRNAPNYGTHINTNFVHLLENFANTLAPSGTPLVGQMWYDKANDVMRYYTGSAWLETSTFKTRSSPPPNNFTDGSVYFDTVEQEGKIYFNGAWQDINRAGSRGPAGDGTEVRTLFLTGTDTNIYAVTAFLDIDSVGNETVTSFFSQHPAFELSPSDPYYGEFTTPFQGPGVQVEPGLNLRQDSSETAVWKSQLGQRASTSYALNTGSYSLNGEGGIDDNGGANIAAANVFHHGDHSIPVVTNTYDLGNVTNEFANLYVSNINISTGIIPTNSNVFLGTDDQPIRSIFVTDIEVDGNLIIEGNNVSIGSETIPVNTGYFNEIYVYEHFEIGSTNSYSFPTEVSDNSILVSDGNSLVWFDVTGVTSNIVPGDGISVSDTPITTPDGVTTVESEISVDAGLGLQFGASSNLEVNLADFTTDDLPEGNTNVYFTDIRVFESLESSPTIDLVYNNISGDTTISVPGNRVASGIQAGSGTRASSVIQPTPTAGVLEYQVDVAAGNGLRINNTSNTVEIDPAEIVASGVYTGGTSIHGSIDVNNSGVITISGVNTSTLGLDNNYVKAGSNSGSPQSRSGTLTIAGIQISTGQIQNVSNPLLTIQNNVRVNGTLQATGDITGSVTGLSDSRIKTNVTSITDCLMKVNRLTPVAYDRTDTGVHEIGLIAQDVQNIFPEVVRPVGDHPEHGPLLGIQYANMVSVLVGAIQDLTTIVEQQKTDIHELRDQIRQLRDSIGD